MTTKESNLYAALNWASLAELPPEYDGENIYIDSLALVSKRDGTKSYVAMTKDDNGNDKIIKDFGTVSQIVKVEKIYPYIYLDSSFLPNFESNRKEPRIKWLSYLEPDRDWESMSVKELNHEILMRAIRKQKMQKINYEWNN